MKFIEFKQKIKTLPVFSTGLLSSLTDDVETLKVQLSMWKKKGLIVPIRRGLYLLNKEDRKIEPSLFYLANQMFIPSYVSLESALAYYGLIPEFVAQVTSVTSRKTCKFKNEVGVFSYQHLHPKCFTGFNNMKELNDLSVLIANPEKAVVDFLYLNLSKFNISDRKIFTESYRFQNCEKLNKKKIKAYGNLFGSKKLTSICDLFIEELIK
ncbi:MAG: hypothetical protein HY094_01740 [Candidatus Melainabacteria bacterium]|nr:hypothetical protein [Candidatus Melainabacteria bacterium]